MTKQALAGGKLMIKEQDYVWIKEISKLEESGEGWEGRMTISLKTSKLGD